MKKAMITAALSIGAMILVWGGLEFVVNGFDFAKAIENINLPMTAAFGGVLALCSGVDAWLEERKAAKRA